MAAVNSDGSDFGDDMALMPSMKAHTGGQGLGAASAPAAAVPLRKVAVHRPHAADVLLAGVLCSSMTSLLLPGWTFAQEIIMQRTPARMDADLGAMNVEDAREVRKADTKQATLCMQMCHVARGGTAPHAYSCCLQGLTT